MIVKDEAAIVERLIDSVAAHLSYYVVCDTGSTDDTVDRVRSRFEKHGVDGEIHNIPFGDFSQARNLALDRGRNSKGHFRYFLLADADMEMIVDDPDFAGDLSERAYSVKQESGPLGYYNTRIVRADAPATYIGATHEYLQVCQSARLSGARFLHHECGSSRVHKIERDTELLLKTLEDDPDNARAMFYLAQTCRDAGRFREAIDWYEMHIRSGGSDEERWYARYQIALCYLHLKDGGKFVAEALRAYSERPWRIEPLYHLARHHRLQQLDSAARLFLEEIVKTPYPESDQLFIDETVYRFGIAEELSYAGLKLDSLHQTWRKACFALTTSKSAPPEVIAAARLNSHAYACSASEMFGNFDNYQIDLAVEPGYCALNPSVAFNRSSLHAIVRTSNFMNLVDVDDERECISNTQNVFVDFDAHLKIVRAVPMVDRTGRKIQSQRIHGYEDCRLFFLQNSWWCTATVRDNNPQGICQLALLQFELDGGISKVHMLESPRNCHEKNWVPLVHNNELFLVYMLDPTTILKCDTQTGHLEEVVRSAPTAQLEHLRGGSQAIGINDGWLYIAHEVVQSERTSRSYRHRFVFLDGQFRASAVSDPFFFLRPGIEYCAGLALNKTDKKLLVSFGADDRAAHMCAIGLESVLTRLHAI
jgi:tetratricopeptide (TPR) repeat protein